ncbi:hypothetical protein AGLY_014491 [Aphis glycines]|uniref:Uncharacterized protein n=1 Tax=Aphis glycines TaxID=307491 RepID=A0A6G0T5A2_APHGL|nr:hypothetical protein AGLY_014491 [Aphis glycines]
MFAQMMAKKLFESLFNRASFSHTGPFDTKFNTTPLPAQHCQVLRTLFCYRHNYCTMLTIQVKPNIIRPRNACIFSVKTFTIIYYIIVLIIKDDGYYLINISLNTPSFLSCRFICDFIFKLYDNCYSYSIFYENSEILSIYNMVLYFYYFKKEWSLLDNNKLREIISTTHPWKHEKSLLYSST